jgi:ribosomal protein S18 acetylase RimI-like enzyme
MDTVAAVESNGRVTSRELTPDLHGQAADLLTEAFHTNPAHVWICPDEATRAQRLRWFLGRNVELQARVGEGFCVVDERGLGAMGFWHAPGTKEPGLGMMLRHGLWLAPLRIGIASVLRMMDMVEHVEARRREVLAGRDAWYLHNMVVRADLRGTGIGSALLGGELRRVFSQRPCPAILNTQRPENVVFYRRLGFEVAVEERIGTEADGFTNWMMLHPGPGA